MQDFAGGITHVDIERIRRVQDSQTIVVRAMNFAECLAAWFLFVSFAWFVCGGSCLPFVVLLALVVGYYGWFMLKSSAKRDEAMSR